MHIINTLKQTQTHSYQLPCHAATLPPCRGTCMLTALNVSQRLDYVNSGSVCGECGGVSVRAGGQLSGESFTFPHTAPALPKRKVRFIIQRPSAESGKSPGGGQQGANRKQSNTKKKFRKHIGNE